MAKDTKSIVLGFIHILTRGEGVYRGGYLLTNEFARPLEFHYTSEVRVTHQQRILHGERFEQILFSEVLAKPMTDRQSRPPHLIAVDDPGLLTIRQLIPAPVVYIEAMKGVAGNTGGSIPKEEESSSFIVHFDPTQPKDQAAFDRIGQIVPAGFEWTEPFERIAAALAEIREPSLLAA